MSVQDWVVRGGSVTTRSDRYRRCGKLPAINRPRFVDQAKSLLPGVRVDEDSLLYDGMLVEFFGDGDECAAIISDSQPAYSPYETRRERLLQLAFNKGRHLQQGKGRYLYEFELNDIDLGPVCERLLQILASSNYQRIDDWGVRTGELQVAEDTSIDYCWMEKLAARPGAGVTDLLLHAEVDSCSSQGVLGAFKALAVRLYPALGQLQDTPWSAADLIDFLRLYNGHFNWADSYPVQLYQSGFALSLGDNRPHWLAPPRLPSEPEDVVSEGIFALDYHQGLCLAQVITEELRSQLGGRSFTVHRCPSGKLFFRWC